MKRIISCDWGTSSLRLRLVDAKAMKVLGEVASDAGIANTFERWKASGSTETDRVSFYQSVLNREIERLEKLMSFSLQGDPVVVSGMASSTMGMMELPYKRMPFALDGSDLEVK